MTIQTMTDFARVEDIAADALGAGRRAAEAMQRLEIGLLGQESRLFHIRLLLTGERLFEPAGLEVLETFEHELHILVEREAYYVSPYGSEYAEEPIGPDRRLTEAGKALERVRSSVAEAIQLAQRVRDLALAERIVGRARGLLHGTL